MSLLLPSNTEKFWERLSSGFVSTAASNSLVVSIAPMLLVAAGILYLGIRKLKIY